jgi:hypothetical protein
MPVSNTSEPMTINQPVARLASVMRAAGWEVEFIDLDLTGDQPKANIKVVRADGRWLLARVDHLGRASIERFHRERFLDRAPNTKGRVPLSPQVNDQFLGRSHFEGARSMLRHLTAYIADNATHPVHLADLRAGWAAIMSAPLRIEGPATRAA